MCGISVIYNKNPDSSVDKIILKKINDKIKHRGPDGEGFYFHKNIGMGHRRLSIIDLSKNADQPMKFDDIILTYNGEIYNYLEIKNELIKKGHKFQTKSDSEVIIRAYKEWSFDCVNKFNGMWAFCIYDLSNNKLFLSRDRFGIKPLYYFENESSIFFGSEIKQFVELIDKPIVNKKILYEYLFLNQLNHTNETFFEKIYSLPQSCSMIIDIVENKKKIIRYYDIERENTITKEKDFKKVIKNSIRFRLRSDVTVGTCLSGGLDSSYIASEASLLNKNKNFIAVTGQSLDKNNDESDIAKIVVNRFDLNWHCEKTDAIEFTDHIDKIIYYQDEPFTNPSIAMQYFVLKKSREAGCKVMLDGQGGDEILLGYERYFISYLNQISNFFKFLKTFRELTKKSKLNIKTLFYYNIYFKFSLFKKYFLRLKNRHIKSQKFKYVSMENLNSFNKSSKDIFMLQKNEIYKIQLPKLLKFEDRNSMANSIEARVPFLDHNVVEAALNLPTGLKINKGWSKYILRKMLSNMNLKKIAWRKKKFGFESPIEYWMKDKSYFVKYIKESSFMKYILKQNINLYKINLVSLWKLYNVAKWSEIFNVDYSKDI